MCKLGFAKNIILTIGLVCIFSCNEKAGIQDKNLKENSFKINTNSNIALDSVVFVKETIYESNSDVLLEGIIGGADVDNEGKVFISAVAPGISAIYVFSSEGKYLKKMGRFGRGPGEFESISSLSISGEKLFVLDSRQQRISIFSTHNLSLIGDMTIRKDSTDRTDEFSQTMKAMELYSSKYGDEVLLGTEVKSLYDLNRFTKKRIYSISKDGQLNSEYIVEADRYKFYLPTRADRTGVRWGFTPAFNRQSLITVSNQGIIYVAWTDDFQIEKYNIDGVYKGVIGFSIEKSKLDLESLDISKGRMKIIKDVGYPETWPALHNMIVDDLGKLWVATITESDSTFKWYIIGEDEKLKASFNFSGIRANQEVFAKTDIVIIKNGYFYNREYDYVEGIDRIVKYKINFISVERSKELVE